MYRPCMVFQIMCVLCLCSVHLDVPSIGFSYVCISEVISSFRSLRDGSQVRYSPDSLVAPFPNSEQINHPFSNHIYKKSTPNHSITTIPPL